MSIDWKNRIDWDDDGQYDGTGEDVSERTILREPLTVQYGRDQARSLSPPAAGEMHFELNNVSRDYSPENTGSPLTGLVKPGRAVRFGGDVATVGLPRDAFGRTVSNGVGTADSGGTWTVDGTAADHSVNGSAWLISVGTLNSSRRALLTTGEDDFDLAVTFSVPVLATGAALRFGIVGRWASLSDHYAFFAEMHTTGELRPVINVVDAGIESFLGINTTYGLTHVAGDRYILRARAEDARLRMKIWREDGDEPDAWALDLTDDTHTAGQVGARARADTGNTNALPVVFTVDDLETRLTVFPGRLDTFDPQPEYENRSVKCVAGDALAELRGVEISTDLHQGVRTGDAVRLVLDAAGWPAEARDIDVGATVIGWWWEERTDALTALERLVDSEGPPALLIAGPAGEVVFRDRHHRLIRESSKTSQVTLRDTGAEPTIIAPLGYEAGWRDIVNEVTFSVEEREPASELEAVWSTAGTIAIADGETLPIVAASSDPFFGAVTPVSSTDYQLRSGAVTVTLSRTSGAAVTIFVTATGGAAVLTSLQLRAYPVRVQRTVQIQARDSTSIATYKRIFSYPRTAPWAGVHDARAIASVVLAHRSERLPVVRAKLASGNTGSEDTRLTQQLARRVSHRVTIVDAESGLDDPFYVERIEHTLYEGLVLETVFGCEKAAEQAADVLILGSATRGVLGTNRLGRDGLDDPSTLFILGSAANGVLGTNLMGH